MASGPAGAKRKRAALEIDASRKGDGGAFQGPEILEVNFDEDIWWPVLVVSEDSVPADVKLELQKQRGCCQAAPGYACICSFVRSFDDGAYAKFDASDVKYVFGENSHPPADPYLEEKYAERMGRAREMASRYLANPALFLWPSDNQFQSLILAEKQKEQEFDRKNGRAPPSAFKPGHKKRLSLAGKMGRAVRGAISNQLREDDMQPLLRGAIDKLRSMDEEMLALHREAVQLRHLDRENELLDKLLKLSYRMFKAGEIAFGPPAFDASAPTAPKRKPPSRASDGKASQSSPIGQGRAAPPDVGVPVPSESSVADVLRLSEKLEAEMRKLSHELKRKPKAEEENRELRERFDIFQRIMNSDGLLFCPPPAAIPTAEDYMAL